MSTADGFASIAALAALMGSALWFSSVARTHFNERSPRRAIMFALEALSLAICLGTIWLVVVGARGRALQSMAALVLACGASGLFWSALRVTRNRNFGVVFGGTVPEAVVREGPYRYIRHPLYTAYTLNWTGCSILTGSVVIALGAAAVAVLYLLAARSEEKDLLASDLGPSYAEYKKATGLLLPRLRTGRE